MPMKRYVRAVVCAWVMVFAVTLSCRAQNIPVDPLTGRPNISIPIWDLRSGNLSVPIAVVYSGTGVRVAESEGTAGMSWNLIAGGSVERELRGLPDDYTKSGDSRKGWLYDSNGHNVNVFVPTGTSCSTEGTDYTFINGLANSLKDTEPDHFYFNAPGLSGRFVFGGDGAPKSIPYQDLKFEITRADSGTGAIEQIKITNNVGVVYTFHVKETVKRHAYQRYVVPVKFFTTDYNLYSTPVSFTSSWKLSSIVSPSGASIGFGYSALDPDASLQKISTINDGGKAYERYRVLNSIESPYRLTSINASSTSVDFGWDQNRISNITISSGSEETGFNFVYEQVKDYRETDPGHVLWRMFLKEIQRQEDCATLPSYVFGYRDINLESHVGSIPFRDQNRQDYWGYYNANADTSRTPKIYYYGGQTNAERYRIAPIPGQTPTNTLTGADRSTDEDAVVAGSLGYIRYPTGAFANITFESHRFYDAVASRGYYGGGVRVKSVSITGATKGSENFTTDYEYKLANDTTSGKLVYRPVFVFAGGDSIYRSPDNLAPDGGVFYTRTTMKQTGKGKTVYDFSYPAVYPATSYSTDWSAALTRTARPTSCLSLGNQETGYYRYPFAPSTNYDFEQGLVTTVSDYSESGTRVRQISRTYSRLTTTPVPIKALRYEKMPEGNFIYSQYTLLANVNNVMVTETTRVADEITPANEIQTLTTYVYGAGHKMLESVSTTNSDAITYKTKYRYAYDFAGLTNPDPVKLDAVAMKSLNTNFRHGELIETINTRNDGTEITTGASLTLYKSFGTAVLPYTMMSFPPTTGFAATTFAGTPQQLSIAANYRMSSIIQSYNSVGLPVSMINNKKLKSGINYGYAGTTPVAIVGNAYTEEIVYDGFEGSSTGLEVVNSASNVAGWTGNNAKLINTFTILRRENIQKGNSKYRFSCWVKSPNTPIVTFTAKNGATIRSSGTITYSGAGQWQYLEGVLDVSTAVSPFTLDIVSSASTELDDIRFYPSNATMTTSTQQPLAGITSASDDRGISAFSDYDESGRLRYIKDRNKNIVQVKDYRYRNEIPPPLTSNFDCNNNAPERNENVTYTAPVNCGIVNYAWKADNVPIGTNSSLIHSFTTAGSHTVELTVSTTAGSVSTTKTYCIEPGSGTVALSTSSETIYKCDASHARTITAVKVFGCALANKWYTWTYKPAGSNDWLNIDDHDNEVTFNITTAYGLGSYVLKCVVEGNCAVTGSADERCNKVYSFIAEGIINFNYVNDSPCL